MLGEGSRHRPSPGLVAVVECTYLDDNLRLAARLARHAHVKDWVELAPRLTCDTLVLAHLPAAPRAELERAALPLVHALNAPLVLWVNPE